MHILVSFGVVSLKLCSSFSPSSFTKQKAWFDMFSRFIRYQTYISFYSCYFPCHAYIIIISEIEKLFSSIGMGYQSITPKTTIFCPTCEPKNSSNSLNKQSRFSVPRNDFLDPNSSFETLIYPMVCSSFSSPNSLFEPQHGAIVCVSDRKTSFEIVFTKLSANYIIF